VFLIPNCAAEVLRPRWIVGGRDSATTTRNFREPQPNLCVQGSWFASCRTEDSNPRQTEPTRCECGDGAARKLSISLLGLSSHDVAHGGGNLLPCPWCSLPLRTGDSKIPAWLGVQRGRPGLYCAAAKLAPHSTPIWGEIDRRIR
jgi:hypothetical protein